MTLYARNLGYGLTLSEFILSDLSTLAQKISQNLTIKSRGERRSILGFTTLKPTSTANRHINIQNKSFRGPKRAVSHIPQTQSLCPVEEAIERVAWCPKSAKRSRHSEQLIKHSILTPTIFSSTTRNSWYVKTTVLQIYIFFSTFQHLSGTLLATCVNSQSL